MKFNVLLWLFLFLGVAGCKKENGFVRQENRPGYTVTSFDIPEIAHFQDGRYFLYGNFTIDYNAKLKGERQAGGISGKMERAGGKNE